VNTRCTQATIEVRTPGRGLHDVTARVRDAVRASGIATGNAHVFAMHTSCGLVVNENADPDVRGDLERWLTRLVADGDALFAHDAEGPDDMAAHVRSMLTGVSLVLPVADGTLALGTWQGVFLWEHRTAPHRRTLRVTVTGEPA
jgi:secondary thiamine-phosphate synthase enzyme